MSDKVSRPPQTLAQRREARETKRFVEASVPVSSPTRIAAAAVPSAKPALSPRQLQEQICAEYTAKHGPGSVPDLDHVMAEVWKRLGMSTLSPRQKKQFWDR